MDGESQWLILPLLLIANKNCSQLSAVTLLWQELSLRDAQILLDTVIQAFKTGNADASQNDGRS